MMTIPDYEPLIRQVSKLLTNEEKANLLIWVAEIEQIRAKETSDSKEELRIIKRSEEDHELYMKTALFDIIVQRKLKKPAVKRYAGQQKITGEKVEPYKTRAGIITVFQKAWVIGNPKDAVSYYLNKRGRKSKYGRFVGFVYTEIPAISSVQPVTIYTVKEPAIEKRKAIRRSNRKHRIRRSDYNAHLKHNTLSDFADPDFVPKTPKERGREYDVRMARRMRADPDYEIIDEEYKKLLKEIEEEE